MTVADWYLAIGIITVAAGSVRLMFAADTVVRLIAMNVVGAGSLVILVSLAARSDPIDPVLAALVITGLVITVAFTGVGALLIRRLEDPDFTRAFDTPSDDAGTEHDSDAPGGAR